MADSYGGKTDPTFDRQIDNVAVVCRSADLAPIHGVYQDFAVLQDLTRCESVAKLQLSELAGLIRASGEWGAWC